MKKQIEYSILSDLDLLGSSHCLTTTFVEGEPMLKSLNVSFDEFYPFSELFVKKAIGEGISIVAKHENKVVGSLICEDLISDVPEGLENVTPKMDAVFALLAALDEPYLEGRNVKKGEYYHIFMGSVYQEYTGQKIMTTMVEKAHQIAKKKGFKSVILEATGTITQHIFGSIKGYKEVGKIRYKDFSLNDVPVFKHLDEVEHCVLFTCQL